jgi:hypothetical protein
VALLGLLRAVLLLEYVVQRLRDTGARCVVTEGGNDLCSFVVVFYLPSVVFDLVYSSRSRDAYVRPSIRRNSRQSLPRN